MPMRILPLEPVQPIYPKPRAAIAGAREPQRHIGLIAQILGRAIVTVIVHEKEMINALLTLVIKEVGQPDFLVSLGAEQQNIVGPNLIGPVHNAFQFAPLPKCPYAPTLPLEPQTI